MILVAAECSFYFLNYWFNVNTVACVSNNLLERVIDPSFLTLFYLDIYIRSRYINVQLSKFYSFEFYC